MKTEVQPMGRGGGGGGDGGGQMVDEHLQWRQPDGGRAEKELELENFNTQG